MNYGWKVDNEKMAEELVSWLHKELNLPIGNYIGKGPYIEKEDGMVRIRRLTNLKPNELKELIRKADDIYIGVKMLNGISVKQKKRVKRDISNIPLNSLFLFDGEFIERVGDKVYAVKEVEE